MIPFIIKEQKAAAQSILPFGGRTVVWCPGKTKSLARGLGCCLALLSTAFNIAFNNSEEKKNPVMSGIEKVETTKRNTHTYI